MDPEHCVQKQQHQQLPEEPDGRHQLRQSRHPAVAQLARHAWPRQRGSWTRRSRYGGGGSPTYHPPALTQ